MTSTAFLKVPNLTPRTPPTHPCVQAREPRPHIRGMSVQVGRTHLSIGGEGAGVKTSVNYSLPLLFGPKDISVSKTRSPGSRDSENSGSCAQTEVKVTAS